MVFALVGDYVPSSQTKFKIDCTAKLQGNVFFFLPQRPILDINTKIQITWKKIYI